MVWIFSCMIFRVVYQGNLVKGLQTTVFEKPLTNFDEAISEVGDYYGPKIFRDSFYKGTKYYKNYKILDTTELSQFSADLETGKRQGLYLASSANPNLQKIGSPIARIQLCHCMRPGWPVAKEVDAIINRLFETGLMLKIEKGFFSRREKKNVCCNTRSLDMDILIGCFYSLSAMYIVCGFVFVVEILYSKINH